MARQVWNGTVSFGLVAIPIKLFAAVRKQSVSFNQLDERNMARVRYRKINAETGEEVPEDHIVKGYEISKGRYVVIDQTELEPFVPAANKAVELEEFVDLDEIDPALFDTAYHMVPDGNPKPYALLHCAMAASNKVALGRFVMRSKQYVAAIRADGDHLVMSTLVYANELVDAETLHELDGVGDVDVTDKELAMAEMLVESLSTTFNLDKYSDEYSFEVMKLIEAKAAGDDLVGAADTPAAPKVVDIMAALEASVAASKQARSRHPSANKKAAARSKTAAKKTPAKKRAVKKTPAARESA